MISSQVSFAAMSLADVDAHVVEHQGEIGADGIEPGEVAAAVAAGACAVELRPFGYALVRLKPAPEAGKVVPHLWVIYVAPDHRGHRAGHRFVRVLLKKYASDYHMSLSCHGAARRRFFGRLGFRVESRDGEWRTMTTNDWQGGYPLR